MEIFYLYKHDIFNKIDKEILEQFSDGRSYNSKEKYYEHLCGIFLTKYIAKNFYNLKDTTIEVRNKKPFFKSNKKFFSISHSKDMVLVAFNNNNIGADVEFMGKRDFKQLLSRYKQNLEPTAENFYKFWTQYEAKIKLGTEVKSIFSTKVDSNYVISCVSDEPIITDAKLIKVEIL